VIGILPEQKKIEGLGGNMRLGGKDVLVSPNTLAACLFAEEEASGSGHRTGQTPSSTVPCAPFTIRRRFRHRYEVDPKYIEPLEAHGLIFSGRHPEHPIMQVLELPQRMHPYFIGSQFHPELTSRPLRPSPMFMGLIAAAAHHAQPDVPRTQISDRWLASIPVGDEPRPTGKIDASSASHL
jgi:CTP synthase